MFYKQLAAALLFIFGVSSMVSAEATTSSNQVSIEGRSDERSLLLNGSGMRSRMFIDLYVGSLYLTQKMSDARNIVQSNDPMAIGMLVESGLITSDKLKDATKDGFEKSIGDTSRMAPRINKLLSAFNEPVNVGDEFLLLWSPKNGTLDVKRNGVLLEQVIGLDFKQALFGIWLGGDPVQESLKAEMLGLAD